MSPPAARAGAGVSARTRVGSSLIYFKGIFVEISPFVIQAGSAPALSAAWTDPAAQTRTVLRLSRPAGVARPGAGARTSVGEQTDS